MATTWWQCCHAWPCHLPCRAVRTMLCLHAHGTYMWVIGGFEFDLVAFISIAWVPLAVQINLYYKYHAEACKFKGPRTNGWLENYFNYYIELYMAALCYLSPGIDILFSKIWDNVMLNFHSPSHGLIQDAWGQSTNRNFPELTTYQHDWIIFVWCPHLLTVKKTLNCMVATVWNVRLSCLIRVVARVMSVIAHVTLATGTPYTANNEIQNCFINRYFSYQASSSTKCLCLASQSVNNLLKVPQQ